MSALFLSATSNARSIARGVIGDAGDLTTDAFRTAGFAERTDTGSISGSGAGQSLRLSFTQSACRHGLPKSPTR